MQELVEVESTRYDNLPRSLKILFTALSMVGIALAVFHVFGLSIRGHVLLQYGYYYLLIAVYSSCAFLVLPMRKKDKRIPWYDIFAAALTFSICIYFFYHAWSIAFIGWSTPTPFNFTLGLILCLMVLEGGRRMGGTTYLSVCVVFGIFPLVADRMPGILFGRSLPFVRTIGFHAFGNTGLLGLPTKVIGDILVGFLLFSGVLIASGAGKFFLNLALVLLGRFRGGPAKVAVVSSGFFGSLSGSIFSNIVGTGSVTIPTMKRLGYSPQYAAAIEACASMGGALMPPVMGSVAFVMCVFLGIEYATVIVAAAVPSILYYFGLLMQIDGHAAVTGMQGLPREDIPTLSEALKEGWPFIFVFLFLLWGLLYMRWEMMTPFYASGLMIILSYFSRKVMMTPKRIIDAVVRVGTLLTQSMAIILPIGFVISGLTITGTSASLTSGLIMLGGENLFLILLLGMVTCYILGMAGMMVAAYIFLAVSLAPALIRVGNLNELGVHLFIIYYSTLSVITPPVAAGSFLAATIAGAAPMKTALLSMRLGFVKYFIPLFFVFNPALILQGSVLEGLYLFSQCMLGVLIIAGGLDGYLVVIGRLGFVSRCFALISGILIAFPNWMTTLTGLFLALAFLPIILIQRRNVTKNRLQFDEISKN